MTSQNVLEGGNGFGQCTTLVDSQQEQYQLMSDSIDITYMYDFHCQMRQLVQFNRTALMTRLLKHILILNVHTIFFHCLRYTFYYYAYWWQQEREYIDPTQQFELRLSPKMSGRSHNVALISQRNQPWNSEINLVMQRLQVSYCIVQTCIHYIIQV